MKIETNIHLNGTLIFAFILLSATIFLEVFCIVRMKEKAGIFTVVAPFIAALAGARKYADKLENKGEK